MRPPASRSRRPCGIPVGWSMWISAQTVSAFSRPLVRRASGTLPRANRLPHPCTRQAGRATRPLAPTGARWSRSAGEATRRHGCGRPPRARRSPRRHNAAVTYAAFSPDGHRVASASEDGVVRQWDAATGEPVGPVLHHRGRTEVIRTGMWDDYYLAFSPDGRRLLTMMRDRVVRVWDASTGEPVTFPFQHSHRVKHAQFSPDGRRVVTACQDGAARVWELPRDERPVADLVLLAEVLSGQRIDPTSGLVPLEEKKLHEAFQALRSRYPQDLVASPAQVLVWHRREAVRCEQAGQWPGAITHLDRLINAEPGNWTLWLRRGPA